jgi:hypothetical protein
MNSRAATIQADRTSRGGTQLEREVEALPLTPRRGDVVTGDHLDLGEVAEIEGSRLDVREHERHQPRRQRVPGPPGVRCRGQR